MKSGNAETFKGKGHTNQISDMVLCADKLATCSMDDTVRFTYVPEDSGIWVSGVTPHVMMQAHC